MTALTTRLSTYLDLLNTTEPDRRTALAGEVFTPEGRWIDPPFEAAGHESVAATVGGIQAQFPGHRFRTVGEPDAHHEVVRVGWELVAPDGSVALAGFDVIDVAADGRFERVAGFFTPPAASA